MDFFTWNAISDFVSSYDANCKTNGEWSRPVSTRPKSLSQVAKKSPFSSRKMYMPRKLAAFLRQFLCWKNVQKVEKYWLVMVPYPLFIYTYIYIHIYIISILHYMSHIYIYIIIYIMKYIMYNILYKYHIILHICISYFIYNIYYIVFYISYHIILYHIILYHIYIYIH